MKKVLSYRIQQCFAAFNMLTVKGCTEASVFRHLPNHGFRRPEFSKFLSNKDHGFFVFNV